MPLISTGAPIYVDAAGFVHLPGQPPLKWLVTTGAGDGSQVLLQAIVKDPAGAERVLVENLDNA